VNIDGLHLRPVFRAHSNLKGQMPSLYMPKFQVLASSSELETVRRFADAHYFENVDPQGRTQPSMVDWNALYRT
jgi:hypothetical protein